MVSSYVAVGDPVPGGGVFSLLVTETLGFPDGTLLRGGPLPGLNDAGEVAFLADFDEGGWRSIRRPWRSATS